MKITILLLTKNVLAEASLQKKLQRLNYEVFCSSSLLKKIELEESLSQCFSMFHYTIISETVSDFEMKQILPRLAQSSTVVIRKSDQHVKNAERETWYEEGVKYWVSNESTLEELREIMIDSILETKNMTTNYLFHATEENRLPLMTQEAELGKKRSMSMIALKPVERAILNRLYQSKGEIVSREDMCKYIWDGVISNSNMVKLSVSVKRLREKLQVEGLPEDTIQTIWRKGYQLADHFFLLYCSDVETDEAIRQTS
ncbi:transcriptional regulator [Enterococcus florum]|uniref:Transcriptional regulator n=1 Tax=Enterococcus florum TaxID=2480627 RepID=A0A4P5PD01_9ENTE|nr:helix-turn-helix domain-containing protein [Enterococcus florum]GCF93878.1 transcriptional regulator [Enterococcus florum]